MKSKVFLSIISLGLAFTVIAQNEANVSINGKLNNARGDEEIILKEYASSNPPLFTSKVANDGSFSIEAFIPETNLFKLELSPENFISLIIGPNDKVIIQADAAKLQNNLKISGSAQTTLLYIVGNNVHSYELKLDSINSAFDKLRKSGTSMDDLNPLRIDFTRINQKKLDYIAEFIKNNPESLVCLFFIDKLDIENNFEPFDALDKSLFKKYPDNIYVKNLHSRIDIERKLAIGAIGPEIILPDPDSNIVKLSSLRGNIVLIDFWAGWCGPCRRENPNLAKLYSQYHNKGFEVFGVSLDKSRKSWLDAIESDGIVWTQVSDLKFWDSVAAKIYNVKSIPHTVLIDKDGRIIAKRLRGKELEDKLEELLGE